MLSSKDPIMEKALNKLQYVSADEQLRYEIDMREKWVLDHQSRWNAGIREAKSEGREEGRAEIIQKMKAQGMSIEEIAKITSD